MCLQIGDGEVAHESAVSAALDLSEFVCEIGCGVLRRRHFVEFAVVESGALLTQSIA